MKVLFGSVLGVFVILSFLAAGFVGGIYVGTTFGNPLHWFKNESSSQVIESLKREDQIVLLSLGVQDIKSDTKNSATFANIEIPGSTRQLTIQYKFNAKLGIEGKDVGISETGSNEYTITIPEFSFIGYENLSYGVLKDENGLLSWFTPEIEESAMINLVLSENAQQQYVDAQQEILQEQAAEFYSEIVQSTDPEIELKFKYSN